MPSSPGFHDFLIMVFMRIREEDAQSSHITESGLEFKVLLHLLASDNMANSESIELAKKYCKRYHEGQIRKGNNQPYDTHPFSVAKILEKYGYDDPETQCIAILHDIVEDSEIRMNEIQEVFGYEISNGVYVLSRNKGKMKNGEKLSYDDYIQRLFWARNKIKRVKIADIIDNTRDLEVLGPEGIDRKISDAEKHYIPWGREIAPIMVKELVNNIDGHRKKTQTQI